MSDRCHTCGNVYDEAFTVHMGGRKYVFDSFECAIHACAPRCEHCGCPVIGHGVQQQDRVYCCSHCASEQGVTKLVDRV